MGHVSCSDSEGWIRLSTASLEVEISWREPSLPAASPYTPSTRRQITFIIYIIFYIF